MARLLRRVLLLAPVVLAGLAGWVWVGLPSRAAVAALARQNPGTTRLMLQREQEAQARGRRPRVVQAWVPLSSVSRHLIHAVLAAEDQRFFGHAGVDWEAIQSSIEKDVEKGRLLRGGSTITQQLAKNLYFGTGKTLTRKLRELVVARWLEADLTKARILTLYLNVIEWGDGIYGAEAAARTYFHKSAADLNAQESALLAAAIINPRLLPPAHPTARLRTRQQMIMRRMGAVTPPPVVAGPAPVPTPPAAEPVEGLPSELPGERIPAQPLPQRPCETPPCPPS